MKESNKRRSTLWQDIKKELESFANNQIAKCPWIDEFYEVDKRRSADSEAKNYARIERVL